MTNEPEPNGWELMRSIKELKESVDKMATGMVTQTLFALYQQGQTDKDAEKDKRIGALETELTNQRKTKAQQWFGIGLAILTGAGGLVTALVIWGLSKVTGS